MVFLSISFIFDILSLNLLSLLMKKDLLIINYLIKDNKIDEVINLK